MLWVCRTGRNSIYEKTFLDNNRIYLSWEGFGVPLYPPKTKEEIRQIVIKEMGTENRTSVSNWAGQLRNFAYDMQIGDYVLIPSKHSSAYSLAKISGNYEYSEKDILHHSRKISILIQNIPRSIFTQTMVYSLCAYRTVFKIKEEAEAIKTIKRWVSSKNNGVENG